MNTKPLILAIDDEDFYLNEIRMELEGHAMVKTFKGPSNFEEHAAKDEIESADLILVDYDFGRSTAVKSQVAQYIREEFDFKGKLVLCTLMETFGKDTEEIERLYDGILPKSDLCWENVEKFIVHPSVFRS